MVVWGLELSDGLETWLRVPRDVLVACHISGIPGYREMALISG